jgi:hypothetical protein
MVEIVGNGRQAEQAPVSSRIVERSCTCLVEGEKIRSEGGYFRSGLVGDGGHRHSRVRERVREKERGIEQRICY